MYSTVQRHIFHLDLLSLIPFNSSQIMTSSSTTPPALLTLSPLHDLKSRPILLLHSSHLPSTPPSQPAALLQPLLSKIHPSSPLTLVYLHAAHATSNPCTTLSSINSFRNAYLSPDILPPALRARLEQVVLLHVPLRTRGQIYLSSFSLPRPEYDKIVYCDLLSDLEAHLGLDSTLLGLSQVDFTYDDTHRVWLDRSTEQIPIRAPDPSKPLLHLEKITWADPPSANPSQPPLPEP